MRIGTSLFLIAVGAILRFAVHTSTSGFDIQTAGLILIVIGLLGLTAALLWLTVGASRRERYVERPAYVERERPVQVIRER